MNEPEVPVSAWPTCPRPRTPIRVRNLACWNEEPAGVVRPTDRLGTTAQSWPEMTCTWGSSPAGKRLDVVKKAFRVSLHDTSWSHSLSTYSLFYLQRRI